MSKKLFLVGCSYSDNLETSFVYGNLLAQKINYEYVHLAMGLGSNYRMWRYATKMIIDKKITADDLLIVQYTDTTRLEFWSDFERNRPLRHVDISEPYPAGGTILKYKFDAHKWQENHLQKLFLKFYQDRFCNPVFDDENFSVHNYNFQCMLAYNNIKTVFIKGRGLMDYDVIDRYKPYVYAEPHSFRDDTMYCVDTIRDPNHMNTEGHKKLANMLYDHILSTKVLLGD